MGIDFYKTTLKHFVRDKRSSLKQVNKAGLPYGEVLSQKVNADPMLH